MTDLRYYLGKLRRYAGARLYGQLAAMVALGLFDGVGLYMLVPMLGLLGFLGNGAGSVPFAEEGLETLRELPESLALPLSLAVYVLIVAAQAFFQREQSVRGARLQQGFIRHLRLTLYDSLLHSNWPFFIRRRKSDFHHLLTSELARVSQATHLFLQLTSSLVFTIIQIGIAFWLSAELTAVVLVSGAVIALAMRGRIRRAKEVGNRNSELSLSYYAGLNDHFSGIKDIKSNRLEASYLDWFRALTGRMEANFTAFARLQASTQSLYRIAAAALIALFVYLSFEVLRVGAGQLLLIVILFARLWPRFTAIQAGAEQIVSAIPAFQGLRRLERECGEAREPEEERTIEDERVRFAHAEIECRGVSFRYGGGSDYALRDVTVTIPAGKMTAIVGKSGAGKSTLADVLMGLLEPESGSVLFGGRPATGDARVALRHAVSYVAQDPFLFHASIRDNLLCVRPNAGEEELWDALRFAASDEFVKRLPEGLDTIVGDRGVRLSGGERQRLVLARAILRKPSILVLDEATSALDTDNEEKIRQAIDRLKGTMTIIVIAHRLTTIRGADQVIAMERGEASVRKDYRQDPA
ncbi:ABC transporter ATP-binding protein [Cohnella thailandensis]|uniref:ABC transporter ATP-binding protein n=1 Tax=Cohnella thailandensis TaxID=557557 RepID=A0A841T173_9BACL|nr:ABC transporter ATP-binding protein [Cohnella thailandensis]MBB6635830.1 ABC transporter ATP-binding protein [Cohnella thailandensis]MBP1976208.1 ATP-binding cassette subfamily C protein [Cohnella thailandensis]